MHAALEAIRVKAEAESDANHMKQDAAFAAMAEVGSAMVGGMRVLAVNKIDKNKVN